MGRWEPDARERLERAALELFVEQGFGQTTVPQITARAGLTTRTFFRHFTDKREVLFADEQELPGLVARMMADAPQSLGPMVLIEQGLRAVAESRFEGRLEQLQTRRTVVQSDEGLRERELRKLAVLSTAMSQGFRDRGVQEPAATVAAQIGVTVFSVSVRSWLDQDGHRPLVDVVADTLQALRSVTADLDRSLTTTSADTGTG